MNLKKLLDNLPMVGLGAGFALAGASAVVIGFSGIRKNFYGSGMLMAGGAWLAYTGAQVAIGNVERIRGLR